VASILREVFSNRNILAIGTTNMLYQVFNGLWELWWSLYLLDELKTPVFIVGVLAAIQNTSQILFQLPGGIIADRIGRKSYRLWNRVEDHCAAVDVLRKIVADGGPRAHTELDVESLRPRLQRHHIGVLAEGGRGSAFGAYRMFTNVPQIFMPVVSGYYFEVFGLGRAVRYGLLMFTGAMIIVTIVRAIVIKETLEDSGTVKTESALMSRDLWKTFRSQPRTIYAMLGVAVIGGFAMRMTWTFLTPYAINVAGLTYSQYGMLQSLAMGISVPLYLISGMIADRFGRVPLILLARGLGPFDSLSLYLFKDYNQLLMAYGVIGVAGGLGGGRLRGGGYMGGPAWQALIADIVPSKDRAKIMGLMGTISGVVGLPGSLIGGYLYDRAPSKLLLVGSILEALSIPIILLFVREPKASVVDASEIR